MPFTQREIDEVWETTCRLYGVDPADIGVRPPILGREVADQEHAIERMYQRLRKFFSPYLARYRT